MVTDLLCSFFTDFFPLLHVFFAAFIHSWFCFPSCLFNIYPWLVSCTIFIFTYFSNIFFYSLLPSLLGYCTPNVRFTNRPCTKGFVLIIYLLLLCKSKRLKLQRGTWPILQIQIHIDAGILVLLFSFVVWEIARSFYNVFPIVLKTIIQNSKCNSLHLTQIEAEESVSSDNFKSRLPNFIYRLALTIKDSAPKLLCLHNSNSRKT